MTLLRIWVIVSAAALTAAMAWAFAPVLVLIVVLLIALGAVSAGIVYLARRYEARRGRNPD